MESTKFTLSTRDWLRGLLMAVAVPALLIIQQSIAAGEMTFNWAAIGMAAVSGLVAYLLKNFLTDDVKAAEKTIQKAEQKQIEKQQNPKI